MAKFEKDHIPWNKGRKGYSAGKTNPFYGKHHTKKTRKKIGSFHKGERQSIQQVEKRVANFREEKHYCWKGEKVGYRALHNWVKKYKGEPKICKHCGKPAKHWANIDHKYRRNLSDYIPLCVSCHKKYDKRNNLVILG